MAETRIIIGTGAVIEDEIDDPLSRKGESL